MIAAGPRRGFKGRPWKNCAGDIRKMPGKTQGVIHENTVCIPGMRQEPGRLRGDAGDFWKKRGYSMTDDDGAGRRHHREHLLLYR